MADAAGPILTVVIPALNEERRLRPTLEGLRAQTAPKESYEVILVDGGSTDGTVDIAKQFDVPVLVSAQGHGRQRNAGAWATHTEWIAFLDADCTPDGDWLTRLLAVIASSDGDLIGGPVLIPPNGTWVERAWDVHQSVRRLRAASATNDIYRFITTQNLAVTRRVFDDVNGFDEQLTSGEDSYFIFQCFQCGARLRFDPHVIVYHRGEPKRLSGFLKQQLWHCNREVWHRLAAASGGRVGQNAVRYGMMHAFATCVSVAGLGCAALCHSVPMLLMAIAVYVALPVTTAIRTAWAARAPQTVLPLAVLYWAFGFARAAYLVRATSLTYKADRF